MSLHDLLDDAACTATAGSGLDVAAVLERSVQVRRSQRRSRVLSGLVAAAVVAMGVVALTSGPGLRLLGQDGTAPTTAVAAAPAQPRATTLPAAVRVPLNLPGPAFDAPGTPGATKTVSLVAAVPRQGSLALVGMDAGTSRFVRLDGLPSAGGGTVPSPEDREWSVSPNGRWIVVAKAGDERSPDVAPDAGAWIVDLATASVDRVLLLAPPARGTPVPGRPSNTLAVLDDGSFLVVRDVTHALWRYTADGDATEYRKFGEVQGVAAASNGMAVVWRHFEGGRRLDVVVANSGSVAGAVGWPDTDERRGPVAAARDDGTVLVRDASGVLSERELATGKKTGAVVQASERADWIGVADGVLVTLAGRRDGGVDEAGYVVSAGKAAAGVVRTVTTLDAPNSGAATALAVAPGALARQLYPHPAREHRDSATGVWGYLAGPAPRRVSWALLAGLVLAAGVVWSRQRRDRSGLRFA